MPELSRRREHNTVEAESLIGHGSTSVKGPCSEKNRIQEYTPCIIRQIVERMLFLQDEKA